MSKLSFRARALDATKPLPIYHAVDLPDLSEYNTINRTVPQMPTGMEKEEETERHLQDVILAQQTNSSKKHVVIPTPENAINVPYYQKITTSMDKPPPRYIRLPGLSLDEDLPDYDLDSEDEEWLSLQTNEKPLSCIHFERMMDRLEKGSGNTVLSEREAQALLKDDEDLVMAVYDYWLAKRLRLGRTLNPTVKQERRDGSSSGSNPYLAFRKRTEKMQTRKNRKNDETAYMQMQKLKRDLDKAYSLSGLVKEREAKKHALAEVHMDIFKKRYLLEDWSGSIMTSLCPVATRSATSRQNSSVNDSAWDGSSVLIKMEGEDDYDVHQVGRHEVLVSGMKKKRKKKYYFPNNVSESPLPSVPTTPDNMALDSSREYPSDKLQEEDGKFTFRRKPHVKYHSPYNSLRSWPWSCDPESPPPHHTRGSEAGGGSDGEAEYGSFTTNARMPKPKKFRFSRLTMSGKFISLCRRRIGRGSRTLLDRIPISLSDEDMDTDADFDQPEVMDGSRTTTPLFTHPASSSGHTPSSSPLPSVASTPSHIQRQHSVIMTTPVRGERLRESLVQSQSVPVLSSHSSGSLTNENESENIKREGVGGTRGVVKKSLKRSLHFVDRTPSPTSNFEFPPLPFINQPHPSMEYPQTNTPNCSDCHHYHPSRGGYSAENMSLRRLPSFSDYREETSTFSSLPTSHFTLRPSSFDTELDEPPTFWNWNHPGNGPRNEKNWQRHSSVGSSSSNSVNSPHPSSSAPSNYGSNLYYGAHSNYSRQKSSQQVPPTVQESSAETKVKDVSRSSLSVTDSKTIVLTNSPAPWHSGASGDKKKEADKLHQNHKLAGNGSLQAKKALNSHGENGQVSKKLKKLVQDEDSKQNNIPSTASSPPLGVDSKASGGGGGGSSGSGGGSSASGGGGGGSDVATGGSNNTKSESNGGGMGRGQKDETDKGAVLGATKGPNGVTSGENRNTSTANNRGAPVKDPSASELGTDGGGSETLSQPENSTVVAAKADETKEQDVWSLKGPSNGILSMNVRANAKRNKAHLRKLRKSDLLTVPTLQSALLVTSQFVAKPLTAAPAKKKDEAVSNLDALPSIGGMLVRSSSGSRSGSSTPTILNSMDAQKWSGGIGSIGATVASLSASKLTELSSIQQQQENMVSKGSDGKRTNSVSDGSVGHGTSQGISQQQHTNVSSPGTNGTNFQEIFSSTKRKLSENTERGIKQALAGTVMNHNSLLENAAKPLVSQSLKNSSEVT